MSERQRCPVCHGVVEIDMLRHVLSKHPVKGVAYAFRTATPDQLRTEAVIAIVILLVLISVTMMVTR